MAIGGDYAQPVTVNGFTCRNCTDVDYARKHIDPAHPKDGPYGVNASDKSGGAGEAGRRADLRKPALNDPAAGARLDLYA